MIGLKALISVWEIMLRIQDKQFMQQSRTGSPMPNDKKRRLLKLRILGDGAIQAFLQ